MKSIYEVQVAQILKNYNIDFVEEYKFHPVRKWRFDFALKPIKKKIAIEVEGGIWTGKGRHSHGLGFIKDCEKYNQAQIMGWVVLRYTPETLFKIIKDLKTYENFNYRRGGFSRLKPRKIF